MEYVRAVLTGVMSLLALCFLAWALAAHGGRWSVRLDALTHFAPLVLAAAVLPLVYGLAVEHGWARGWLVALSAAAIALAAGLIAPEYLRPARSS